MDWNRFFIAEAKRIAQDSKDPSSKVGCIITEESFTPVTKGYNGFVTDCDESLMTWERPKKYGLVIHAEMRAILSSKKPLKGCKAFITDAPCDACLKHLLEAGIREVYYDSAKIMQRIGTKEQAEIIETLINSTGAIVKNINGTDITEELACTKVGKPN